MNNDISGSTSSNNFNVGSGPPLTTDLNLLENVEVVNGTINDTSSSAAGPATNKNYVSLPNAPLLTPPNQSVASQPVDVQKLLTPPQVTNLNGTPSKPTEKELNDSYDKAFDEIIKNDPNAAALRFEHYMNPGPPKTAAEKKALEEVALQYGLTSQEFTPTAQKSEFVTEMNLSNDDEFTEMLQNQKPPLTKEEIAQLTMLHYNPGAKFPGSDNPKLQADLKNFEALSEKATAAKFGIPLKSDGTPSVPLSPNTETYNAVLNGFYVQYAMDGINNYTDPTTGAPLTDAQATLLKKSFVDPTVVLPASLAAIALQVKNSAIAQVIASQNLGAIGFTPAAAGTFPQLSLDLQNMLNTLNSSLDGFKSVISSMPDGPQKSSYLNILGVVTAALDNFRSAVYASQGTTSAKAQENSVAKLQVALNKIASQTKAAKEAAAKFDKIKSLGLLGQIIMAIILLVLTIVAAVVSIGSLGTAAAQAMAALAAVYAGAISIMVAIAAAGSALMATMMAVATNISLSAVLSTVVEVVTSIGATLGSAAAMKAAAEIAIQVVMEVMNEVMSSAVQVTIEAVQNILARAIQAATSVTEKISMKAITEAVGQVFTKEAFKGFLDGIQKVVTNPAFEAAQGLGDVAQGGMSIAQSSLKAQLAIFKANAEADATLADADIAIINKLIQQLLALLSGQTETVQYVSGTMTGITNAQSRAISQVFV